MSALTLSSNSFASEKPANIWFVPNAQTEALACSATTSGTFDCSLEPGTFLHAKLGNLSRSDLEQAPQYQRLQRIMALQTNLALCALSLDAPICEDQLAEALQQAASMAQKALRDDFAENFGADITSISFTSFTALDASDTPLCTWKAPATAHVKSADGTWTCGNCGTTGLKGAFCGNCGTPRG